MSLFGFSDFNRGTGPNCPNFFGGVAKEPNWGGPIDGGEIDSKDPSAESADEDEDAQDCRCL